MLKDVLYAQKEGNQGILIAGSGTMGWDAVAANLVEAGEDVVSLFFPFLFHSWTARSLSIWVEQTERSRSSLQLGSYL